MRQTGPGGHRDGCAPATIRFPPFELDVTAGILHRADGEILLPPKVAGVLHLLLERAGTVVTKDELLDRIWQGAVVTESSLAYTVSTLRQILGDDAGSPIYIQTLYGRGYRFIGKVESAPDHTKAARAARSSALPSSGRGELGASPSGAALRRVFRTAASILVAALALVWLATAWSPQTIDDAPGADMATAPVTSLEGEELEPALSPDGTWVAFIWDQGRGQRVAGPTSPRAQRALYVMQLGVGSAPRPLAAGPLRHAHPAWSPSGNHVAFVRWTPGRPGYEIVIKPLGDGLDEVVYSRSDCRYPNGLDWSPDGRYLAFPSSGGHLGQDAACAFAGKPQGIVLLDLEDAVARQLTSVPADELVAYMDALPAFSPQGGMLAFRRSQARGGNTELFVVPLDRSHDPRSLVIDPTPIQDLDWTPDGEHVVFALDYSAAENFLGVVPADGNRRPSALAVGVRARSLSVADTMSHLVYSEPQERYDLYVIGGPAAEGPGVPTRLPASSTYDDRRPDFSPSGEQITFASDRGGTWEVYVAGFPDGSARQVTDVRFAEFPQWSPDGQEIAYTAAVTDTRSPMPRPPRGDVFVVDLESGKSTNLTNSDFHDAHPGWGPNGEWIYFQSVRKGGDRYELWRIPRAGGEARQVTDGGDLLPRPFAGRLYFHGGPAGVLSAALSGGHERVFAPVDVGAGNWDVWRGKLVYLSPIDGGATSSIRVYDPETGEDVEHARIPIVHSGVRGNIYNVPTVSPDGRWLLYSGSQAAGSDLIRLDNIR